MKKLFKALADFQQEVPIIHKGTQGYGYSYADLTAIFNIINPLMKKHGLGFTQLMEGKDLRTIVFHIESGETIESLTDIPQGVQLAKMNEFQVLGSSITYMRRYTLSAVLGLITDKDTDASNQTSSSQPTPKKAAPVKKTKTPEEIKAATINKAIKILQGSDSNATLLENWNKVKASVGKEPEVLAVKEEMKALISKQAA